MVFASFRGIFMSFSFSSFGFGNHSEQIYIGFPVIALQVVIRL